MGLTNIQKLSPPSPASNRFYGDSVALSGTSIIVGEPFEGPDFMTPIAPKAHVYTYNGSSWSLQQTLTPSDAGTEGSFSQFGTLVDIDGDIAVVAAPISSYDSGGGSFSASAGAAYIYTRSGSTWTQAAKVTDNPRTGGAFWSSYGVAVDGTTIAIASASAVRIFIDSGGSWIQQQRITIGCTSLSLSGDTLIIGDSADDTDAAGANTVSDAGAARIYTRSAGVWSLQQKIVATGTNARNANDWFGHNVRVDGDTAVVASYFHDYDANGANSVSDAGAAFVFERSGSTWTQTAKLAGFGTNGRIASDACANVSVSGNVIVYGSPFQDYDTDGANVSSDTGRCFIFYKTGSTWNNGVSAAGFGSGSRTYTESLGYWVDIDNGLIVAGAPGNDIVASEIFDSGAAFTFNYVISDFVHSPTGGLITGGVATCLPKSIHSPTGGLTIGGVATVAYAVVIAASGGLITGGIATCSPGSNHSATGGLIIDGTSEANQPSYHFISSGSILISGSIPDPDLSYGDGLALRGASPVTMSLLITDNDGGLVFSGIALTSLHLPYEPTSGLILSDSSILHNYYPTAFGGMILISGFSFSVNYPYLAVPGELTLGGSSDAAITYSFEPSGGLSFGGVATSEFKLYFTSTGGLTIAGDPIISNTRIYIPSGSLILSGAPIIFASYQYGSTIGTLTFGGQSIIKVDYTYFASPAGLLSGFGAISEFKLYYRGTGGLTLSASSPAAITEFKYLPKSGLSLFGIVGNSVVVSISDYSYEGSGSIVFGRSSAISSSCGTNNVTEGISCQADCNVKTGMTLVSAEPKRTKKASKMREDLNAYVPAITVCRQRLWEPCPKNNAFKNDLQKRVCNTKLFNTKK